LSNLAIPSVPTCFPGSTFRDASVPLAPTVFFAATRMTVHWVDEDAVAVHRIIAMIEKAAESGSRIVLA
jgi:hypothetical protein